jgi:hypothetical protein
MYADVARSNLRPARKAGKNNVLQTGKSAYVKKRQDETKSETRRKRDSEKTKIFSSALRAYPST